jgi:predicted NBD/HSP70 family sugar kinase
LNLVYVLVDRLLQESKVDVVGIGVGTPDLMIPSTGVVLRAINLDWDNLPIGELLSQRFSLPVYVVNDCQAAAMGEYIWGEPRYSEHLILVKLGSEIGAGIIINGCIYHGDGNGAGEIGHIQVMRDGLRCRCGNLGCLETVFSEDSLIRVARDVAEENPSTVLNQLCSKPENISIHTVKTAYEHNDENVLGLVHHAAGVLGEVVAHMVGVLNINHIRIAGRLSCFGKGLMDPIHDQLFNGILPGLSDQIDVCFSKLGDEIVIQGAASIVLKNELGMV